MQNTNKTTKTMHIVFKCTWDISRIGHMLGHKLSLSSLKEIDFIQSILSNHNGMKLEINNRRETGTFTKLWKLNNTQSMDQRRNYKEN